MNDALNELMMRMTVKDLQRARASSQRARDDEAVALLSERLSAVSATPDPVSART